MKLLFYQYAERVYKDTLGNYYTSGSFPPEVWERYLNCCDELIVLMRKGKGILEPESARKNKQYVCTDRITLRIMPDRYASVTSYLNYSLIKTIDAMQTEAVNECDAAIVRGASPDIIKKLTKQCKPYMIEVVGCTWDALWNHGWKGKIMAIPSFFCAKKEIKRAPWVLYVTEKFLQKRYPTNGKSCACSDVFIKEQSENILTERLQKIDNLGDSIILGTIAAVDVQYKGQEYVIKALAYLKSKGDLQFKYQMVGGGDPTRLKKLARRLNVTDQVEFCGQVPHEDIFDWLKKIDIYIQPSLQEGLPRSIIEAMSSGCPVLGSEIAGIPELIDDECLFKKGSPKAVAESIIRMVSKDMSKYARRNFVEAQKYTLDKLDKKRKDFYDQFLTEYFHNAGISGEML